MSRTVTGAGEIANSKLKKKDISSKSGDFIFIVVKKVTR